MRWAVPLPVGAGPLRANVIELGPPKAVKPLLAVVMMAAVLA